MFSVIIPLYNKSYSVGFCIDSVLSQDSDKYEVIIVNDGSTDGSLSVVYENYHDEIESGLIKVIDQFNQGVSVARNNGIRLASCDYVCFLDADDEWRSDYLSNIYRLIIDFPEADLYCLAHLVRKNFKSLIKPKHGLPENHYGYVDDFFKASSRGSVAKTSKVCVRKKAFLEVGGFPAGVVQSEDLYVWIMMAMNGRVACKMSYSMIANHVVDSSRSSRKNTIPYPLVFFSKNKKIERTASLNKYLFSIFRVHFLYSLFQLRFKEAVLRLVYFIRVFI